MKIYFKEYQPLDVAKKLRNNLAKHSSKGWIDLKLQKNKIIITVSKLGTSKIFFSSSSYGAKGCCWELTDMKVAFAHKLYREDFKSRTVKFFQQAGGIVKN
jgi:hypothetical protein